MGDPLLSDDPGATRWRVAVTRLLDGASLETLAARSRDGVPLGPLFPSADPIASQPWRDTAAPLAVAAIVDHPDPAAAASLARADAEGGAAVLSLAFAGAAAARGFGIPVEATGAALGAVDLRGIALRCEPPPFGGAAVVRTLAALFADRAITPTLCPVDLGVDPLGDMARTGRLPPPPGDVGQLAAETVQAAASAGHTGPILRADGRPHHEAGASEAEELAAVLSTGVAYLRGLAGQPDVAQGALGFTLAADADLLLTVAKFRALRRLWARVEEACGLDPRPIRLHGETAWRMLARPDPWTNLLRNTVACAGAMLGGADSVAVLPFTAALGLPDAFARRLARNTPLVLRDEAHLARIADPTAGSGAFEAATDGLCRAAWAMFQQIEAGGGLAAALRDGRWQARVAASRAGRETALRDGAARLVGVTAFMHPTGEQPRVLRPMPVRATIAGIDFPPLPSAREAAAFEDEMAAAVCEPPASRGDIEPTLALPSPLAGEGESRGHARDG